MRASEIRSVLDTALEESDFFKGINRFYDFEDDYETVDEQKASLELNAEGGKGQGIALEGFIDLAKNRTRDQYQENIELEAVFYYSVVINPDAKKFYEKQNPRGANSPDDWRGKNGLQIAEELMQFIRKEVCDCHQNISLHDTPLVRVPQDHADPYLQWDVVFNVKCFY